MGVIVVKRKTVCSWNNALYHWNWKYGSNVIRSKVVWNEIRKSAILYMRIVRFYCILSSALSKGMLCKFTELFHLCMRKKMWLRAVMQSCLRMLLNYCILWKQFAMRRTFEHLACGSCNRWTVLLIGNLKHCSHKLGGCVCVCVMLARYALTLLRHNSSSNVLPSLFLSSLPLGTSYISFLINPFPDSGLVVQ